MKVFLDANILFSAANPKWLTRHLLDAIERSGGQLVVSAYVVDEAERNVRRHFPEHLREFGALQARLTLTHDAALAEGQFDVLPEKDRPVLAAAIHSQCTHLLTGDIKHFGILMGTSLARVTVVSQRLLAEELTRG